MANAALKADTLQDDALIDVLRLIRSENVGPVTFFALIARYGNAADALHALPELAARGGRSKPFKACSIDEAQKEIEAAATFGAQLIAYGDARYPLLLKQISDPPPVITVAGNPQLWSDRKLVAMVGARNASANGCSFAQMLARDLGAKGCTIISGLARGIDTAAHKAALSTGTVAVIAGGIDHIYPPENEALYHALREKGAIVTEQPFGAAPVSRSFPARNRIIAGMSQGVVVVEASLKSGSLITARDAAEQGRDVFAVPGSPLDPRCEGTNKLLRDGAIFTERADDILSALTLPVAHMQENVSPRYAHTHTCDADERVLTRARALVLEKLGPAPVLVDELISQCQLTPGIVHTVLLEFELAGKIVRTAGNRVALHYI